MALSASESALLTETCENMNIAANTCREVLEMLRSLGNTGVVDIATHNNAATAHANSTNLVQKDPTGTIFVGTAGAVAPNLWPTNSQIELIPAYSEIMMLSESKGNVGKCGSLFSYHATEDSSGNLIDLTTAGSVIDSDLNGLFALYCYEYGLKNGVQASVQTRLGFYSGAYQHEGNYTYSTIAFTLANGSASVYAYLFNTDSFYSSYAVGASLGNATSPWNGAYFRTAATITSDRREKSGISAIGSEAVDFIKALRPVHFTVKLGKQNVLEADEDGNATSVETIPGTRRHWGLIAQEVQEALVSAGYDPSACAVWSLADKNDPDSKQALRYEELIAPMIKVIQQQQERIEALERKVA